MESEIIAWCVQCEKNTPQIEVSDFTTKCKVCDTVNYQDDVWDIPWGEDE